MQKEDTVLWNWSSNPKFNIKSCLFSSVVYWRAIWFYITFMHFVILNLPEAVFQISLQLIFKKLKKVGEPCKEHSEMDHHHLYVFDGLQNVKKIHCLFLFNLVSGYWFELQYKSGITCLTIYKSVFHELYIAFPFFSAIIVTFCCWLKTKIAFERKISFFSQYCNVSQTWSFSSLHLFTLYLTQILVHTFHMCVAEELIEQYSGECSYQSCFFVLGSFAVC